MVRQAAAVPFSWVEAYVNARPVQYSIRLWRASARGLQPPERVSNKCIPGIASLVSFSYEVILHAATLSAVTDRFSSADRRVFGTHFAHSCGSRVGGVVRVGPRWRPREQC